MEKGTRGEQKISSTKELQLIFAKMPLGDLSLFSKKGNGREKTLAEKELKARYSPCVYNKNDKIKLDPHWLHSREWQVDDSSTYRSCVTYQDPKSPEPEQLRYLDRIYEHFYSSDKEELEKAELLANEYAKPSTAEWLELYLSSLTKEDITVNCIITGISNDGYPWNAIGYTEEKDSG